MKNQNIENDMIDHDHRLPNAIGINVRDRDQDLVIIDQNIIDIVDRVHHDENDHDQDQNDVHLEDVQVHIFFQHIIDLHIPNHG